MGSAPLLSGVGRNVSVPSHCPPVATILKELFSKTVPKPNTKVSTECLPPDRTFCNLLQYLLCLGYLRACM